MTARQDALWAPAALIACGPYIVCMTMSHRLLSLSPAAPAGFEYRSHLQAADLRGGAFALFAESVEQAEAALGALGADMAGVVVTWTDSFAWQRRAPQLFHVGVPPEARGDVSQMLIPALDLMTVTSELELERPQSSSQLIASRQMLANILENFPGVVFWKDRSSTYLGCNRNFSAGAGLAEPAEIVGKTDYDLPWAQTEADAYRRADREVMETGTPRLNIIETQLQADGRVIWFDTNKVPLFGSRGNVIGVLGTSNDITERKRAEDALAAANARLLEEDARKSDFLGLLSHELRNPLSPIRNSVHLLKHAAAGNEQALRAIAIIDRQVSHLTHLVDDLLDIMRIKHGKTRLQRSRLDLVEVVRNTVEDHRALLQRHSATLRLPPEPLWVNGDRTRLAQVVGNLLTNAAKFTPEGGKIAVALSRREGRAILEVTDTGIGIDKEMLGRLFQPFAQADRSLDRSRGGLGLGLKLVRELVSLHEGEVDASSAGPGRGARFIVSLPCEVQTTETRATDASQDEAAPASRNVLVIEDHRDAAETLAEALELFGHHVAIAYDGPSGLAKARELRPEVVLCDIGLPAGMDGYAVSRALREDPSTKSMFLVALTGYAEPADRRRAMDAGFDAHVAKPPDLAALRGLLAGADHR